MVEVAPALRRAREALFKRLIVRVSERYNEAQFDLSQCVPESAVDRLMECQELLASVEEDGE